MNERLPMSMTNPEPPPTRRPLQPLVGRRPCTCLGACRGANGLADNWYCVLDADEGEGEEAQLSEVCDRCGGAGDVPTAEYESYFGAQMKPCPKCHGTLEGLGHGRLS